jgi:hypothetical protein
LLNENFALSRTGLNNKNFSIYTIIEGYTNIRILNMIYLAVDRSFPYHLNTFNDVEANFSDTALGVISSSDSGERSYTNTINYTELAATIGATNNRFGSNINKCHVALYLSAIFNKASETKSVKVTINSQILNQE